MNWLLSNTDINPPSATEATLETHVHTRRSHTKLSSTKEGRHAHTCAHIHTIPICIHRGTRRRALNGHTLTLTHINEGNRLLLPCSPLSNASHTVHAIHSQSKTTTVPLSHSNRPTAPFQRAGIHTKRHSSNSYGVAHLFILNNKVRITLIVIKDDEDLWVHPVIHAGVEQIARGVSWIQGRRPAHGRVAHRELARQDFGQEHVVHAAGGALGEVVRVDGLACEVAALAEHGGVLTADARIEVVLADALDHILGRAVEQVALVQHAIHLRHAA